MAVRFKRSYHDRKETIARRKRTVLKALIVCFSFQILFSVFVSTIKINTISMKPGLNPGNIVIYSPFYYGLKTGFLNLHMPPVRAPGRGDLIVFSPPYTEQDKDIVTFMEPIIKFLTFGKINLEFLRNGSRDSHYLIKRVLAVPGDTVRMEDFKVFIKPKGADYFLNEFEVIDNDYDISVGQLPNNWDKSLPFSGNLKPTVLKENEYFVLGDNRMMSSDSVNWGPLTRDRIRGKVIARYWPLEGIRTYH